MIEQPLVSIIVPIYNVESYLHECVDSVIAQTYTNLEIILVDDGSPDRCPIICDEYAKQDSRIQVIHKPNGGLSDARNAGMKIAKGKYLSFVDSDDMIHNQMIEVLMNPILDDVSVQISCCNFKPFYDDTQPCLQQTITSKTEKYSFKDYFTKRRCVAAWSKIYTKELFDGIEFPVGRYHEDVYTTYKLCYKALKITYTDNKLYFYRQRKGSIMSTYSMKRITDLRNAYLELIEFSSNKDKSFFCLSIIDSAKTYSNIQNRRSSLYIKNCDKQFIQEWKNELLGYAKNVFGIKQKMSFFMCVRITWIKNLIQNLFGKN